MYKIIIAGSDAATQAATWLQSQDYDWQLDMDTHIRAIYTFGFTSNAAASHFALKWK
jgi:hypothetical protein